jgi:hypothetical protein
MNTYAFPLGSDHLDYDATRVAADLRAQRGSGATSANRSRRHSFGALLGSVIRHTTHHSTSAHAH